MNAISPPSYSFSIVEHIVSNPKPPNISVGKHSSGIHTEINIKGGKVVLTGAVTSELVKDI